MKVTKIQRRLIEVELKKRLDAWIEEQPEAVQVLAREFPLGTNAVIDEKLVHLIGYTEDDHLLMSEHDPALDYEGAVLDHVSVCADHIREVLKNEPVVVSESSAVGSTFH